MFSNLPLELGVIARSRNQCDTAGIDYSVPAGEFLKKFGKDIESMTDIAIEAFIQHKEIYIVILGIVCVYYFDKIMKS